MALTDFLRFISAGQAYGGEPGPPPNPPWPDDGLGFVGDGQSAPGGEYDLPSTSTSPTAGLNLIAPAYNPSALWQTDGVPPANGAQAWLDLVTAANPSPSPMAQPSSFVQPPAQTVRPTPFQQNPFTPVGLRGDLDGSPSVGFTYDSADSANDNSGLPQPTPNPWQTAEEARNARPGDSLLAQYGPNIQTPEQAAQLIRAVNDVNTPALPTPGTVGQILYAATTPPKPLGDLLDVWHQIQQNNADTTQAMRDMATRAGLDPDVVAPLPPAWEQLAQGAGNAAVDLGAGFTSPLGLATLGMGALPKAIQRAATIGFSAPMLGQLPGQIQQIQTEENKPDDQIDWRKLGGLYFGTVANAGLGTAAAVHGLLPSVPGDSFFRPDAPPTRTDTGSSQYPLGQGDLLPGSQTMPETPGGAAADPTTVVPPGSPSPSSNGALSIRGEANSSSYPFGAGDLLHGDQPIPPSGSAASKMAEEATPAPVEEAGQGKVPLPPARVGNDEVSPATPQTSVTPSAPTPVETKLANIKAAIADLESTINDNQAAPKPGRPTGNATPPTTEDGAYGRTVSEPNQSTASANRVLPPDTAVIVPRPSVDPNSVAGNTPPNDTPPNVGPQGGGWRANAEQAALKLEGLKSGISGSGQLHAFGIVPYLWDGAVAVAQGVIRAGGSTSAAIDAAVRHVRTNYQGKFNETGARRLLAETLNNVGRGTTAGIRSNGRKIVTNGSLISSVGSAVGAKQLNQPKRAPNVGAVGGSAGGIVHGISASLRPYGGTGGGHHVLLKKAFEGAKNYDLNAALAIPNEELARLGLKHKVISGRQQTLYRAFAKTGERLTLDDIAKIEEQALIDAKMDRKMAKATVQKAVAHLKAVRVPGPTRIPWKK